MNDENPAILPFCFLALVAFQNLAQAHEELSQKTLAEYVANGTLQERKDRIANLKQFRMTESHAQRAIYKMRRAALEASGVSPADAARALTSGPSMAFPYTARPE